MAEDERKTELIAELARARSHLAVNFQALRRDLDFPTRAKNAFKRSPLPWLGGAAFIGLLVAKFPRRTKKVTVVRKGNEAAAEKAGKFGLALGALKIAFDLARPALTTWLTKRGDHARTACDAALSVNGNSSRPVSLRAFRLRNFARAFALSVLCVRQP